MRVSLGICRACERVPAGTDCKVGAESRRTLIPVVGWVIKVIGILNGFWVVFRASISVIFLGLSCVLDLGGYVGILSRMYAKVAFVSSFVLYLR